MYDYEQDYIEFEAPEYVSKVYELIEEEVGKRCKHEIDVSSSRLKRSNKLQEENWQVCIWKWWVLSKKK